MAAKKSGAKTKAAPAKKAPAAKGPAKKGTAKKPAAASARMTLVDAMTALAAAGSEQTRKTYLRHGAKEPLFGVSFATLKVLVKRVGVDHELALALWGTGNHDARTLAVKVADPAGIAVADLDRWARTNMAQMCGAYVACLASEGSHGVSRAKAWLAAADATTRCTGWTLVGSLAMRDESAPDAWFLERVAEIEKTIHAAPNAQRYAMNGALISIGCRSAALRKSALAAANRIGTVDVDHGDTSCKTPDAAVYIEKAWAHAASKKFESPAAQERAREPMRLRC
jgi:3-methyladenine DNA glycosylase AlkD